MILLTHIGRKNCTILYCSRFWVLSLSKPPLPPVNTRCLFFLYAPYVPIPMVGTSSGSNTICLFPDI